MMRVQRSEHYVASTCLLIISENLNWHDWILRWFRSELLGCILCPKWIKREQRDACAEEEKLLSAATVCAIQLKGTECARRRVNCVSKAGHFPTETTEKSGFFVRTWKSIITGHCERVSYVHRLCGWAIDIYESHGKKREKKCGAHNMQMQ